MPSSKINTLNCKNERKSRCFFFNTFLVKFIRRKLCGILILNCNTVQDRNGCIMGSHLRRLFLCTHGPDSNCSHGWVKSILIGSSRAEYSANNTVERIFGSYDNFVSGEKSRFQNGALRFSSTPPRHTLHAIHITIEFTGEIACTCNRALHYVYC